MKMGYTLFLFSVWGVVAVPLPPYVVPSLLDYQ